MNIIGGLPISYTHTSLWPHIRHEGNWLPLKYLATLEVHGKTLEVFYGLEDENIPVENWVYMNGANAALVSGSPPPSWVSMRDIKGEPPQWTRETALAPTMEEFQKRQPIFLSDFPNTPESQGVQGEWELVYQLDSTNPYVEGVEIGDGGILSIYMNPDASQAILTVDSL